VTANTSDDQPVDASLETVPQHVQTPDDGKGTYGQILKSSALVGGSSVLGIMIRIVRTKAMAMLLGPAGFGLFGLYGSVELLVESIAGMGINSSGVRQIAEAVGSGDTERIARTSAVLRRISVMLGLIGAALLIMFSRQVSALTFGNREHTGAICLLSLAVFFQLVSYGQAALVQGMRRIGDLARMAILGALFGTLIGIPLVFFLRANGVVPSLVGVAAMSILSSWWYSRKLNVQSPTVTASQLMEEAGALLKLGFVFMASSFMITGLAYGVRILVLRNAGVEATGLYQSAWALGGLYAGLVIQAMGADFYPRLTASATDNVACNRLVNEQVSVALLIAGPGVLATLTFAPLVITLFYSAKFGAATAVLRWICLGTFLQVITWPMGFIIVAKGKRAVFFWAELACALVYGGLAWICVRVFGLNGAGIAFFISCMFHGVLHYPIVHKLSGFEWSVPNQRSGLLFFCSIAAVFCGFYVLPFFWAVGLGTMAALLIGVYSLRILIRLMPWTRIPRPARRIIVGVGLAPSGYVIDEIRS
jgi:antigen flippase